MFFSWKQQNCEKAHTSAWWGRKAESALSVLTPLFLSVRESGSLELPLLHLREHLWGRRAWNVAERQPSWHGLLQTVFNNFPFEIMSWKLSHFPSPSFTFCHHFAAAGFGVHTLDTQCLVRFSLFNNCLVSHHLWSFKFPTVAPPKSNCLAPHFWHHSLLPWKVPPIQHDDFPARRRGCSERETTFV